MIGTFFIGVTCILTMILQALHIEYSSHYYEFPKMSILVSGIFGAFGGALLFLLVGVVDMKLSETEEIEEHMYYISSIKSNVDTEGRFFLGSGSIESVEYYYAFRKTTRGFKRVKVPASRSYIVETDSRRPEVVKHVNKCVDCTVIKNAKEPLSFYTVYVPKGTIIRKFSLN